VSIACQPPPCLFARSALCLSDSRCGGAHTAADLVLPPMALHIFTFVVIHSIWPMFQNESYLKQRECDTYVNEVPKPTLWSHGTTAVPARAQCELACRGLALFGVCGGYRYRSRCVASACCRCSVARAPQRSASSRACAASTRTTLQPSSCSIRRVSYFTSKPQSD